MLHKITRVFIFQILLKLTTLPEHSAEKVTIVLRRSTETQKPQSVVDYNAAKKGVDYSDQMSNVTRPCTKFASGIKK